MLVAHCFLRVTCTIWIPLAEMQCKTGNSDDIYFQTYGSVVPVCSRGWRREMGGWGDGGMGDGGSPMGLLPMVHLLLSANEVCEGYVFTPVCQSFCSWGRGVPGQVPPVPGKPPGQVHSPGPGTPPRTRYPQDQVHPLQDQVHPPGRYIPWGQVHPRYQVSPPSPGSACLEIRATSGRYASYWNALLFLIIHPSS